MSELQWHIIENHHMVCNPSYGCPVVFSEPFARSGILRGGGLPVVLRSCREGVAALFSNARNVMKLSTVRPIANNLKAEA